MNSSVSSMSTMRMSIGVVSLLGIGCTLFILLHIGSRSAAEAPGLASEKQSVRAKEALAPVQRKIESPPRSEARVEMEDRPIAYRMEPKNSVPRILLSRKIDRQYGLLYKICALTPIERERVRQVLMRKNSLLEQRQQMIAAGNSEASIDAALNQEEENLKKSRDELASALPEVSKLLTQFESHPLAVDLTHDLVERIGMQSEN